MGHLDSDRKRAAPRIRSTLGAIFVLVGFGAVGLHETKQPSSATRIVAEHVRLSPDLTGRKIVVVVGGTCREPAEGGCVSKSDTTRDLATRRRLNTELFNVLLGHATKDSTVSPDSVGSLYSKESLDLAYHVMAATDSAKKSLAFIAMSETATDSEVPSRTVVQLSELLIDRGRQTPPHLTIVEFSFRSPPASDSVIVRRIVDGLAVEIAPASTRRPAKSP